MLTSQHTLAVGIATVMAVLLGHPGQAQVNNTAGQTATPANVVVRSNTDPNSSLAPASYRVHAYVNQAGKLHLLVNNPERLRYKIEVVDQQNRSLYEEFTNHDRYNRRLDLSALPENACQVIIKIDNKQYEYRVKRQETRFAFIMQDQPAANQPSIDQPHQDRTERLSTPITLE